MQRRPILIAVMLVVLIFPLSAVAQNVSLSKTLRRGSSGNEVRNLQNFLRSIPGIYPEALVTGYFGALTEAAVKRFQSRHNIVSSGTAVTHGYGVVGPRTRSAVNGFSSAPPPPTPPQAVLPSDISISAVSSVEAAKRPYFSYSWRGDDTVTGEVTLPTPVARPVIVFNGQKSSIPQTSAALRLAEIHEVVLADDEEKWSEESATMLLEMMQRLQEVVYTSGYKTPWKVVLTNAALPNDVMVIVPRDGELAGVIKISKAAFVYANPVIQASGADTSARIFYSNRLYRAVLKAFFNERNILETILRDRYGIALGYADPRDEFQDFTLEELQYLATVFEDLPSGFRHIPGLEKVVRRKNGLTNPVSPQAPAIAWVSLGYIEFMDFAFNSGHEDYIRRLIAHEMTHFVWHHVLTEKTKKEFMAFSGWSLTMPVNGVPAPQGTAPDHPKGRVAFADDEVWYRKSTTNFVSDYAAQHNPDEDFSETVSHYIYLPDRVRTIAPEKYTFVKNIINGYEYVVLVDEKYTFQVFNLHPDVTFPGKIVGTDIQVYKTDDGSNRVIMTLTLSRRYGDGAKEAYARLFSPQKTFFDISFYPLQGDAFTLRSEFTIPKTAANGYWLPDQITVQDAVDNRRQEGQAQFGWLLYVNNPKEDLRPPVPDVDHITYTKETISGDTVVKVFVPVTDEYEEGLYGYAELHNYADNQFVYNYAEYDYKKKSLVYEFIVRKYHASGQWAFREFNTIDLAENRGRFDLKEKELTFSISTMRPDTTKPELDLNAIQTRATPRRPEAPNGETDVSIWYRARDDNAGLGIVSYQLLKPTGGVLFDYHYHSNFHTPYFVGDPTQYQTYEITLTLPPGSPPGTWVLQQVVLKDKAGNILTSNFIETGILKPFEVE